MKKRQRKKWSWMFCSHMECVGLDNPPYIFCKRSKCDCKPELCCKFEVPNRTKHVVNIFSRESKKIKEL